MIERSKGTLKDAIEWAEAEAERLKGKGDLYQRPGDFMLVRDFLKQLELNELSNSALRAQVVRLTRLSRTRLEQIRKLKRIKAEQAETIARLSDLTK